ncbi:MAG: 2-C-methyl-D-erythritol 4-phosphate cytidylyltransferase [Chloroflexi bacterium]|nr:2-C-methyl-D-erythritol 4-phosphate cytidylyltransferase [Chloroflexota bacterium]
MGFDKLFAELAGRPVLAWTLDAVAGAGIFDRIVLVVGDASLERARSLVGGLAPANVAVVPGGARRQDSVCAGLAALPDADWIAVHDGARPLVQPALFPAGLAAARESGAALAAIPVQDTIKVVDMAGFVRATPDRQSLFCAQTPQVFRADLLRRAHAAAAGDVTDDAALVEALGVPVRIFPGAAENLKITTPVDLAIAAALLRSRLAEAECVPPPYLPPS